VADLHVWTLDDCDWVIAAGRDDAIELLGMTAADVADMGDVLVEMPDDAGLGISIDDATGDVANFDEPAPSHVEHHTCREWVERFGRCYLATTEY
jgi:hypothetical protein